LKGRAVEWHLHRQQQAVLRLVSQADGLEQIGVSLNVFRKTHIMSYNFRIEEAMI